MQSECVYIDIKVSECKLNIDNLPIHTITSIYLFEEPKTQRLFLQKNFLFALQRNCF